MGSVYHDIQSADQSARAYNREMMEKSKLSLRPLVSPVSGAVGMSVTVRL